MPNFRCVRATANDVTCPIWQSDLFSSLRQWILVSVPDWNSAPTTRALPDSNELCAAFQLPADDKELACTDGEGAHNLAKTYPTTAPS